MRRSPPCVLLPVHYRGTYVCLTHAPVLAAVPCLNDDRPGRISRAQRMDFDHGFHWIGHRYAQTAIRANRQHAKDAVREAPVACCRHRRQAAGAVRIARG